MSTNLTFEEFAPGSKAAWLEQIERELKGKDFSTLQTELEEGITLNPAYTAEDLSEYTTVPARAQKHVDLSEAVLVTDEKKSNAEVLDLLNRGTSSLLLYIQPTTQLSTLLNNVLIQHIAVHFVVEGDGIDILKQYEALVSERGLNPSEIRGSINVDPIESAARTGAWRTSSNADVEAMSELNGTTLSNFKTLCINANLYHNAGATASTELALTLAHAHEYIAAFGAETANRIWVNMAIGKNYLTEVAKFRAFRLLWAKMMEAYNASTPVHIYAETGLRNKTIYDPNVNMLRTTTEAMSALVGGVDEIRVQPYDITFRTSTNLAQRVARNQALVAQYEAFASKVSDPASGSYVIESITKALCEKAWNTFREIEANGGLIAGLSDGSIQSKIEAEAASEQSKFDNGSLVLVGTNKFPNADEKMGDLTAQPLFASSDTDGKDIRKIVAKRLSENAERERLNAEK